MGISAETNKGDILPLVNKVFNILFGQKDNNSKAIRNRGWNPANYFLLTDPEILKTRVTATATNNTYVDNDSITDASTSTGASTSAGSSTSTSTGTGTAVSTSTAVTTISDLTDPTFGIDNIDDAQLTTASQTEANAGASSTSTAALTSSVTSNALHTSRSAASRSGGPPRV